MINISHPLVGRDKAVATTTLFVCLLLGVVNYGDVQEVKDVVEVEEQQ